MKILLKKIFKIIIPNEENKNIPHILRAEAIFILVIFVGALFYFNQNNSKIIKGLNLTATVYPAVLADLANKDRLMAGASELSWSKTLEDAAKLKAEDMSKNGYFAHTSPTGITPWHWLSQVDYNFVYAGENLAIDFTESENVENAWLNSPKHRENIMNQNFTEIGIATTEGVYNGRSTTFVVEFFGKPLELASDTEISKTNDFLTNTNKNEKVKEKVAGASIENLLKEKVGDIKAEQQKIEIIEETDKFIAVKNDSITEELENTPDDVPSTYAIAENDVNNKEIANLSTWYERFIFNPTKTIEYIYISILVLVFIAIILMLKKEYQRHHRKHFAMGIALMIVIVILIYVISLNGTGLML